ncbi:MAG: non-canonical purine NTP pyrophosphatase, partial [Chloroflexota bacterium]
MKFLFASNNTHKRHEVASILRRQGLFPELHPPKEISPGAPEPTETGSTFKDNALIKAKYYYNLTGMPSIADDSGLEIDALNGAPGVRTARFAGEDATDADNRKKALKMLANVPESERAARFRCVICFYDGAKPQFFEGACEGRISNEEAGENGFGYDP